MIRDEDDELLNSYSVAKYKADDSLPHFARIEERNFSACKVSAEKRKLFEAKLRDISNKWVIYPK